MAELEIRPALKIRLRVLGLICAGVVVSATLVYLLAGGGQEFFAVRSSLTTYMPDADGLLRNDDVRLSGFEIGEVQSVELSGLSDPNRAVRVRMSVLTRYLKMIPQDSETAVGADTMVGEKFLGVATGTSAVPVRPDGILRSRPVAQTTDRADLMKALHSDLAQVDQILTDTLSPNTDIGKFILGEQEYDTVVAHIEGFDQDIHTVLVPQSNLGQAFYSDELYNQIHNLVLKLDGDLAAIQNGEGTAGRLFASDSQYHQVVNDLISLRTSLAGTNAGKGKLGAALENDDTWKQITSQLAEADATISSINAGEGKTGALLANAQLYESLNGALRKIDELLRDIREHPRAYTRYKR